MTENLPLHLKYRPKKLSDFFGNSSTKVVVKSLLEDENHPHSYLISGNYGCGKTSLARFLSYAFRASSDTILELDCGQDRSIDTIRMIERMANTPSFSGNNKAFIIDEAHTLLKLCQDALLKVTEETGKDNYFFLCSTQPENLSKALRNRLKHLHLKPLEPAEANRFIRYITQKENLVVPIEVRKKILGMSQGIPRSILLNLQTIAKIADKENIKEIIEEGADPAEAIELCRQLAKGTVDRNLILGFKKVRDLERVRRSVLGYFTTILINRERGHPMRVLENFGEPFTNGFPDLVLAIVKSATIKS